MAFVGKSAWIVKPTRRIEFATKPKTVSYPKRGVFLFEEDQEKTVHGDGAPREDDFFRADEQLGSSSRAFRRPIDDSLQ
jgi:hypothetical protein